MRSTMELLLWRAMQQTTRIRMWDRGTLKTNWRCRRWTSWCLQSRTSGEFNCCVAHNIVHLATFKINNFFCAWVLPFWEMDWFPLAFVFFYIPIHIVHPGGGGCVSELEVTGQILHAFYCYPTNVFVRCETILMYMCGMLYWCLFPPFMC